MSGFGGYEFYGMFQMPLDDLSRAQLETRPGFDPAGEAGGLLLGSNVSFMSGVAESRDLPPSLGRTPRAVIQGVVSDPQDALGGPWNIGSEGFPTTNSSNSLLTPTGESVLAGVVMARDRQSSRAMTQKEWDEHWAKVRKGADDRATKESGWRDQATSTAATKEDGRKSGERTSRDSRRSRERVQRGEEESRGRVASDEVIGRPGVYLNKKGQFVDRRGNVIK